MGRYFFKNCYNVLRQDKMEYRRMFGAKWNQIITMMLLLTVLVGCSDSDDLFGFGSVSVDVATNSIYSAKILDESEMASHVLSRSKVDPLSLCFHLSYDGVEIPHLKDGVTYFLTVDEACDEWGNGEMTVSNGFSLAFCEDDVQTPMSEYMKTGTPCRVYVYNEIVYAELNLIFTKLPVMTLNQDGSVIGREEQKCAFRLFQPRSGEDEATEYVHPATIRVRGATSAGLTKVGYAIELYKDGYTDTKKVSLLGMRKDDDWILCPSHSDESKIRDAVSWYMWKQIGAQVVDDHAEGEGTGTVDLRYVEVILNGEYFGMYILMERLDEKTLNLEDGDSLFKSNDWTMPPSSALRTRKPTSASLLGLEKKFPDPEDAVDGSWDVLADFVEFTYESDGSVFAQSIENCVDVENMLDYWLFVNVVTGSDNTGKNTYYATIDGKIHAIPWDLDMTFGLTWGADKPNYLYQDPSYATTIFSNECGRRLIKYYPGAASYVKNRWRELTERDVVTYDNIMTVAESYWNLIHDSGAFVRNRDRWPDGNYVEDLEYFSDTVKRRIEFLEGYISALQDAS